MSQDMEENFSLRPATEDDVTSAVRIEQAVQKAPWTEEHFRSELEKAYSHVYVMTDDETDTKLAGYIVFWLMFNECHILTVAVDLPYRGQGLAKRMIQLAVKLALKKGIQKVFLEVRKSNVPAIQLYQGLHFVITHVRKGFYSDGEDAYQMALQLEGEVLDF